MATTVRPVMVAAVAAVAAAVAAAIVVAINQATVAAVAAVAAVVAAVAAVVAAAAPRLASFCGAIPAAQSPIASSIPVRPETVVAVVQVTRSQRWRWRSGSR